MSCIEINIFLTSELHSLEALPQQFLNHAVVASQKLRTDQRLWTLTFYPVILEACSEGKII